MQKIIGSTQTAKEIRPTRKIFFLVKQKWMNFGTFQFFLWEFVSSRVSAGPLVDDHVSLAQDGDEVLGVEAERADVNDRPVDRNLLQDLVVADFLHDQLVIGVRRASAVQNLGQSKLVES